jgi:hypothetical protein
MQSDGGSTFVGNSASTSDQQQSIIQMIIDGTQGTSDGDGLVQCINQYGNIYEVRLYPLLKITVENNIDNLRPRDATTRALWTALISTMAKELQIHTSMILQIG